MQRTCTTTQSQPCNNLTFTLKHFIFEYLTSKYPAFKNRVFKYLHLTYKIEQPSHARKRIPSLATMTNISLTLRKVNLSL